MLFQYIKAERLTADNLFVVSRFHCRSSSKIFLPLAMATVLQEQRNIEDQIAGEAIGSSDKIEFSEVKRSAFPMKLGNKEFKEYLRICSGHVVGISRVIVLKAIGCEYEVGKLLTGFLEGYHGSYLHLGMVWIGSKLIGAMGILLKSAESREIKITGGGMHGILETRMGAELERRRTYSYLLRNLDTVREQLSDASIEIKASYSQGLKKVEAQLVAHQQGQLWYEQKIKFMKIDLDDKTDVLTYHKKLLAEAQKEKEDLKAKVEKWHNSSKNLSKLLNTQMSANDKFGLGYGDHRYDGILSYENEVLQSVFMNKESEIENQPLYDRFVTAEGMHAVPPPMTGNYMPSGPDIKVDYSQFTYGPKQTQPSESESQSSEFDTCESNISTEPSELVSEPVVNESNVECQPKVWSDAPIIEEYESDSEDEVNKQNQFVPSVVLTRNGKIPVSTARASGTKNFSTARQSFNRQAVPTSTAMKVNTSKPIVNGLVLLGEKGKLLLSPQQVVIGDHKETTGTMSPNTMVDPVLEIDYPHRALKNKGVVDSGCSRHMTGNKAYLAEFQDFNGGPVAFGGSKGYITGKGKIKTGKLDFEDVCFVKELQHFNLFSVSQMCDKKNKVLFTDSECLVLSPEFKLPDANQVLLKIPRQNNMYSFNLENIVPSGGLTCLIAKATTDESNKWHRRLGHVNFKNLNKLVKGNLVRGLPSKIFQNDHTCVACQKGKQHKASCKAKAVSSISHTLQLLHMDLFGPTSVRSLNHKTYCLVITDDFSRFSWVFFLRTKDETSGILKDFIRQIENQLNQKVKTIRCDNGTEFKNKDVIELCGSKGIKREYSNARTPQQNGVAERKNRTLIEAARTMLADSFLPNTFWAEAVSTACYVLNRVLVTKPHNKTPYELLTDAYEKKLIQVLKIHTDDNIADLLTKAFDVSSSLRNLSQIHSYKQALISLLTTITLSTTMVVLDSCPKHNMVAYLEKTEWNAEFHEIIDFLMRSSIHHALTVSPVVSSIFVEQFWTSAKSKIINNVRHITARVVGKYVSISEASIRSDLFFDDANRIDSLPNQAIFDAIQLKGYEGDLTILTFNKALFSP
ncbi:putative ribonuclease H-like domain-containing protein [Tanacetum coccineum]